MLSLLFICSFSLNDHLIFLQCVYRKGCGVVEFALVFTVTPHKLDYSLMSLSLGSIQPALVAGLNNLSAYLVNFIEF